MSNVMGCCSRHCHEHWSSAEGANADIILLVVCRIYTTYYVSRARKLPPTSMMKIVIATIWKGPYTGALIGTVINILERLSSPSADIGDMVAPEQSSRRRIVPLDDTSRGSGVCLPGDFTLDKDNAAIFILSNQ